MERLRQQNQDYRIAGNRQVSFPTLAGSTEMRLLLLRLSSCTHADQPPLGLSTTSHTNTRQRAARTAPCVNKVDEAVSFSPPLPCVFASSKAVVSRTKSLFGNFSKLVANNLSEIPVAKAWKQYKEVESHVFYMCALGGGMSRDRTCEYIGLLVHSKTTTQDSRCVGTSEGQVDMRETKDEIKR